MGMISKSQSENIFLFYLLCFESFFIDILSIISFGTEKLSWIKVLVIVWNQLGPSEVKSQCIKFSGWVLQF